ncbi:MAG TPA: efflux RND transporter periplasmic adaptor subunit, partial [Bacteroidales bacterium]|nr:efflux RND transporter periplasmic adaptor subunit [Bacteroidales bacterium]
SEAEPSAGHEHDTELAEETTWTCSMHPQIRQPEPGDCPICGMDLIPVESEASDGLDPNAVSMSPTAMQLANIQTAVVGYTDPVKKVRMNGKVQSDERLIYSQSSHIPGRIEKLMVNFTGEYLSKGQVIASVYSPDLVTAQEELFEAQKIKEKQPSLFRAAKEKLKNWKLSEEQIQQILESGMAKETFKIRADVSGYVTEKRVNTGDYVGRGQAIYEIADLSRVWVLFDVYESDMPWVDRGDEVTFTIASLPGEKFEGEISFLDPVIDPKTRVAKARVVKSNPGLKLKPEMLASGVVKAELSKGDDNLVVPKSAVMWTGERSVVYVKSESEKSVDFTLREVTLGPGLGESYIVKEGVKKGEEIAVHGTFSIDAAAQLAGKPSMMNAEGGKPATGHNHGGQSAEAEETHEDHQADIKKSTIDTEFKKQLTEAYKAYLSMKDALVASEADGAQDAAKETLSRMKEVNMNLLEGDAHMLWMDLSKSLKSELKAIANSGDLGKQRKAFVAFNETFYKAVNSFGLTGVKSYYQYCPMANNDLGAYWFSDEEAIRNPYYGEMMLKCGEVREVIE